MILTEACESSGGEWPTILVVGMFMALCAFIIWVAGRN